MPVSIGIPFYNAEKYLEDAIRAVFAQTYEDWELILVDDGSTDRSLDIANAIGDSRVRVISDGEKRRLPSRLNQITREARFDFVARMDADDLMSPHRLEKQMAVLENYPQIDLVTSGLCSISDDYVPMGTRAVSDKNRVTGKNILLNRCGLVHAAMLGRKEWFLRNRYDETQTFTEDYELWLRAYSKKDFNVCILGDVLYYYREEGNVTAVKLLTTYKSHRRLFEQYGSVGFGPIGTSILKARSHCKSAIAYILNEAGILHVLLKRRNVPIADVDAFEKYVSEIRHVRATRVAGLKIV